MGMDISRLEKVKQRGASVIARCPACAEEGHDDAGEHLYVNGDGKFGCVLYPGKEGHQHRKRIFELAGVKDSPACGIAVKIPFYPQVTGSTVIKNNILGHLGHLNLTLTRSENIINDNNNNGNIRIELKKSVPTVPTSAQESLSSGIFTAEEVRFLIGIDPETVEKIVKIKDSFNAKVIGAKRNNTAPVLLEAAMSPSGP